MADPTDILCLDVSSTATGYAIGDPRDRPLAGFGVIVPHAGPPTDRIDQIVKGVETLVTLSPPMLVVMEFSSGKVHGSIRKATGLSVLGAAQGAVRQRLRDLAIPVETVGENEWTGSRPKAERAESIGLVFPAYARFRAGGGDPGLDASDAIGILEWYRARLKTARLIRMGSSF